MSKKINSKNIINICLIIFFIFTLLFPIIRMLSNISLDGFNKIINSKQFIDACNNSVYTGVIATIITLFLSFIAAWCMERINIKFKGILSIIFIIPMLIPSISHAFGLVALFGKNGLFTNLLNLNLNIYGRLGIIVGSIMYSFPVSFLMFSNILHYEDGTPYKASNVLGIPKINSFFSITLPYMKKTIISAFFAVFTMIITDYGVPLMIGGKSTTLSVLMFNKAVGLIDYNSGSVIGFFLLLPAFLAFIVDLISTDNSSNNYVNSKIENNNDVYAKIFAYIYCFLICLLVFAPIMSFLTMVFETKYPVIKTFTLKHVVSTIKKGSNKFLLNSIIYALLTSILGTIISFICSYMNSRYKGRFSKILHLVCLLSMAIPGIVLGLSYVMTFHGSILYSTIIIIVLVNTIHFFSSPYLISYNALEKVNKNLESTGLCLGVKRINIILDVIIPKIKYSLLDMFVYFFVNSMMTISAVSFLAPPSPKPISLMINQFEAQLLMESAAFVSLLILIVNLILKVISYKLEKKID